MTYLDLFLIERNALHDVETRCLVGFWIRIVCRLENCLVLGTIYQIIARIWSAIDPHATLYIHFAFIFFWPTYAVLFLLPLGCLSDELLWNDESCSAFSGESSSWTAESALLCGELASCCELVGTAAGDGG